MGLYIFDGDVEIEGVEGAIAVHRKNTNRVELWDTEGEAYMGALPSGMSAKQINAAVALYNRGFADGTDYGKRAKAYEIRAVLGISEKEAANG